MMKLSKLQKQLKILIKEEIKSNNLIVYCYDYVGWVTDPLHVYIECDGVVISDNFPPEWTSDDLLALEKDGFLEKVSHWQNPNFEEHYETTYRVY
ncbi:MAG: hypothetical protein GY714_03565 [Desulfobacterales bacterium]|nr:hypothetical protein [Desulfobacterales bacterium]